MRISGDPRAVRVRMSPTEADTLCSIVADLVDTLRPDGLRADDPVYRRLYPDGYQDNPEAAEAFRALTEASLHSERLDRAETCLAELSTAMTSARKLDFVLDADGAQRWIQVLNDMRLALGTRLDITEDDQLHEIDPTDPDSMPWAIYAYLTGVQDTLVRALMG